MFGLTMDKLVIVIVVALIIIGPTRLPGYAARFADYVKGAKKYIDGAKDRIGEELGPDFDDVDWKKLDPRQYDPRRIIRSALLDDEPAVTITAPSGNRHTDRLPED